MNNYLFIYVCSEEAKNELLARGYCLLKADDTKGIYVFANNGDMTFANSEMTFVYSNTITF